MFIALSFMLLSQLSLSDIVNKICAWLLFKYFISSFYTRPGYWMKKLVKICQIYLDLHHLLCTCPNFPGEDPARHLSNFQVFFQNPTGKTVLCFNKVSLYCLQKKLVVLWLYLWTDDNKLLAIILIDLPTPTPFGVDLPLSAKSTPFFYPFL